MSRFFEMPSKFSAIVVVSMAFIFSVMTVLCGAHFLNGKIISDARKGTSEIIFSYQQRINAVAQALDEFSSQSFIPCSEKYLEHARAIIVSSPVIQDILYNSDGRSLCSAVFTDAAYRWSEYSNSTSFYEFRPSDETTIRRDVRFDFTKETNFTIVSRRNISIVVQTYQYPARLNNNYSRVSGIHINRQTGKMSTFHGAMLPLLASELHSGNALWRAGSLLVVSCSETTSACFVAATEFRSVVEEEAFYLAFLALLGAFVGGGTARLLLRWLRHRRSIASRLRRGLRKGQLSVLYQPIVDAASGRIVAAEALVRWNPSKVEQVPPDVFIPVAEKQGLMPEITGLIIRLVGKDFRDFLPRQKHIKISINIVTPDLEDTKFHRAIAEHLTGQGISPFQIAFELTERSEVKLGPATEAMMALRAKGYQFYIDDFGTGYSSISYLGDLSVDAIKIDKSFTQAVGTDMARARLVGPMIEMAHKSDLALIVEGVENETQAAFFRAHRTSRMQGWLFGRPMTAAAFTAAVENEGSRQCEIINPAPDT